MSLRPTPTRWTGFALPAMLLAATVVWAGPPALDPPPPEALQEARELVRAMAASDRGPYKQIRWFCNDGAVLPPEPYACREHGGGRQHAQYSDRRARLAELGWPVGTILVALPWEEFWDGGRRNQRLRDLLVERYLVDADDGWVLRKARFYRGRVQAEDEEVAGRDLLVQLLADTGWVGAHYLLAREAVRSLPHGGPVARTRVVRQLSQDLAEAEPTFERVRVKLHTSPDPSDRERVQAWLDGARGRRAAAPSLEKAERLLVELEGLFGGKARAERFEAVRRSLARHPRGKELDRLLAGVAGLPPAERVRRLAGVMAEVREATTAVPPGVRNLALFDLSLAAEEDLTAAAFQILHGTAASRGELLGLARSLVVAAYGAGFLTAAERDALAAPALALEGREEASAAAYLEATRALGRAAPWAQGAVRHAFAESLTRFGGLEPKALRFADDLLRGSALLALSEATRVLSLDAERRAGLTHRVLGGDEVGCLGLNPGLARGRLRVLSEAELAAGVHAGRDEIVVLPRTVSALEPVAGILTLAEGNLLSHVQLLARNLGIPNGSLTPAAARRVTARAGEEVLLAVGTDGAVLLEPLAGLPPAVREALEGERRRAQAPAAKVDPPAPDLSVDRPLPLAELHAGLAGRVVGPKAANLGELARLFPGRVAQAVALPFGVYARHASAGPDSPKARLDAAFRRHREGELDADGLAAEVEAVRLAVAALVPDDRLRAELLPRLEELFGPPGTYGVFVRSDTNVEDLPGFTGAGLNETVPNVVGLDRQLAAVARVWASPFARRAMGWRERLLTRPEEVYPSVLLMKSVPAEKSGVLVTADLVRRGPGLTVAVGWGVGGAVDNEAAETLVLAPDGSELRVSGARAPYQRRLQAEGGVQWVPAPLGEVLTPAERAALRALAVEVRGQVTPAPGPGGEPLPWDVEFGFVGGELQLFQIRPLVERGPALADRVVRVLLPGRGEGAGAVPLGEPPAGPGAGSGG